MNMFTQCPKKKKTTMESNSTHLTPTQHFLSNWSCLFTALLLLLRCELLGNPEWQWVELVSRSPVAAPWQMLLGDHSWFSSLSLETPPRYSHPMLHRLQALCCLWRKSSLVGLMSVAFVEKKWIKWGKRIIRALDWEKQWIYSWLVITSSIRGDLGIHLTQLFNSLWRQIPRITQGKQRQIMNSGLIVPCLSMHVCFVTESFHIVQLWAISTMC